MTNILGTADDEELDERTDAEYAADMRVLGVQLQRISDRWAWQTSRDSGTALVPYGSCGEWYNSRGADPVASEQRAWAAAYDFANGYDIALRKLVEMLHLEKFGVRPHRVADEFGPSYLEIRWYLQGEVECDPRVAMRIAFHLIDRRNAWRRLAARRTAEHDATWYHEPPEIGWI